MNDEGKTRQRSCCARIGAILPALAWVLVVGSATEGAEFHVSKTSDTNDIFCLPGPPASPPFDCSLREAIMKANALAGSDTIHVPAGTYNLTKTGRDEDAASTGDLDITDDVSIVGAGAIGPGSRTRIDAQGIDRVFHIHSGARADITDVVITGGEAEGNNIELGGGIFNEGGRVFVWSCLVTANNAKRGGGISSVGYNTGTSLVDSYVTTNSATEDGGGIAQLEGTLLVVRSAFVYNDADDEGGAIFAKSTLASFINVTFSDNWAGGSAGGGGFFDADSTTTIDSCTFSENDPYDLASYPQPGSVRVRNTIVDGACQQTMVITEQGNIEGPGDTCGFRNPGDYTAVPVPLLPLGFWSSGLPSKPPFAGIASLAVDNDWADPQCQAVDQRGVRRPKDDNKDGSAVCDSGAVERISTDPLFMDGFESGDTSFWR